jgi:hypothetical protein
MFYHKNMKQNMKEKPHVYLVIIVDFDAFILRSGG